MDAISGLIPRSTITAWSMSFVERPSGFCRNTRNKEAVNSIEVGNFVVIVHTNENSWKME